MLAKVRELALALPDSSERPSHGQPTFFAAGKMFAQFRHDHHGDDRTVVIVKLGDAEMRTALIEADPERYSRPAYFRADWISINFAPHAPDWEHVAEKLRQSRELATAAKR